MAFFGWFTKPCTDGPIYSVMNEDHALLYRTLKELSHCVNQHCTSTEDRLEKRHAIIEIINSLIAESREHFRREEALMEIYKYPAARAHITEHLMLSRSIEMYISRFTEGAETFTDEVVTYLKSWLTNHIRTTDRELERYLRKAGASADGVEKNPLGPVTIDRTGKFAFLWTQLRDSVPRHVVEEQRKRAQNRSETVSQWARSVGRERSQSEQIRENREREARQQRAIFYE